MNNYRLFKEFYNSKDFIDAMQERIKYAIETETDYAPMVIRSKDNKIDVEICKTILNKVGRPIEVHVNKIIFNATNTDIDVDMIIDLPALYDLYKSYYLLVDEIGDK